MSVRVYISGGLLVLRILPSGLLQEDRYVHPQEIGDYHFLASEMKLEFIDLLFSSPNTLDGEPE